MSATHEPSPASLARRIGRNRGIAIFALCALAVAGISGDTLAQDSDQQIRCLQLQQELASAQNGGGNGADLAALNKQIQDATRVYQGTKAAMEDAGCFQSFLIFGRSLARTPNCLKMNDRAEDAQRQLDQLQGQRDAIAGGGGNRRRQAELMDALARNGCGGGRAMQQQARRDTGGGGFFGWFGRGGGGDDEQPAQPEQPVYRSIDPNGRYRSVCVRTCDGFFFPISYQTYANRLSQDATVCQSSCAAPAELYVYRNPGQEIDQAISLNGTAYADLPAAFKYRKSYINGCSCKADEYNPTEIEAANKKAEATPGKPGKKKGAAPAATQAAAPAAQPQAQLNLDATGATPKGATQPQAAAPADGAAAPAAQDAPQQSSVAKRTPAPTPQ